MLRDITLGQYYKAESPIHRLDPRTKLAATFAYLISLFLFKNPFVYMIAGGVLVCVIIASRVPVRYMLKGMKSVIFILLFTMLMSLFFTKGTVIWSFWKLRITKEGLSQSAYTGLRITMLILGSNILTLTTTPTRLTNALERVMSPLKIFRVPAHEIAMMMSIALRFIPILLEETDRIMKAQLARGADFESGNLFKKVKSLIPVLIPLFVAAFRRANDLAMAMEARCYHGGKGRTQMKPLKYARRDAAAYCLLIMYMALMIVTGLTLKSTPKTEALPAVSTNMISVSSDTLR
ncbi:MAG: energy-coupling factor transporter transmembrane protein EcfT [Lachnospiraceae bacterium]|nr:energy-coupling factor transporter transmembrane protein EcfT [Lachnospiraceae bacterium]